MRSFGDSAPIAAHATNAVLSEIAVTKKRKFLEHNLKLCNTKIYAESPRRIKPTACASPPNHATFLLYPPPFFPWLALRPMESGSLAP